MSRRYLMDCDDRVQNNLLPVEALNRGAVFARSKILRVISLYLRQCFIARGA